MLRFIIVLSLLISFSIVTGSTENVVRNDKQVEKGGKRIVSYEKLGKISGQKIVISRTVDLRGGECKLSNEMTLVFKGGIIKNGTLIGNNTKISSEKAIFDHVCVKGSWLVPNINTGMFADLTYENALADLFALQNHNIKNTITIEKGLYQVNAPSEWSYCLKLGSKTDLIIDGRIKLIPNNYKGCDILLVEGKNITITGSGSIEGDKHNHTGKLGEWGMGVKIRKAENVAIGGLTIKDCWGDCIYIGSNSKNIQINNCNLIHGRRQGISITSADGVIIKGGSISNVSGTEPSCGIDIEPNKGENVNRVVIDGVSIKNCIGGVKSYGGANKASIGEIT